MAKIRIVFDTYDGQSELIAKTMGNVVNMLGHEASVENVEFVSGGIRKADCDAIILGGPLHAGSHSRQLKNFVEENHELLSSLPCGFFSVSLSAAGTPEQRRDALRCMDRFLKETNLQPLERVILAGAVKYREYGFLKRLLMRGIVRAAGGDTDTSTNHVYTKWPEVSQFVERFLAKAEIPAFPDAKSIR